MKIKGQAWSMDITLAVVIFIVSFFVIYAITSSKTSINQAPDMKKEAERLSQEVITEGSDLDIIDDGELNKTKVIELIQKNYSWLKEKLRTDYEFCFYFEDQNGTLIKINDTTGVGSPYINVSGFNCT